MRERAGISRRTLLQTAALGALAGCAGGAASNIALQGETGASVAGPQAPRIPFHIEQLGRRRNDPYRWMKYIPETGSRDMSTLPDMVRTHLEAETDYAAAILAPARALQPEISRHMHSLLPDNLESPPLTSGSWAYFNFYPELAERPVHARSPASDAAQREIIFDENMRAEGHAYFRTTDHQHSPDHRYYAWAEDFIGDDRHRICLTEIGSGETSILVEADAYGYGGLVFSPSSEWLFWIWRDERNRPTRAFRTSIATGVTELVYEEQDPAIFMQIKRTSADGYVAIILSGPDTSEVRVIAADDETAEPTLVYPRRDKVRYDVDEWAGALIVLTDEEGALDNKLLAVAADQNEPPRTLVPHRPGSQILKLVPFGHALVRLERQNGLHQLVLTYQDGREKIIAFEETAYSIEIPDQQDYNADHCRITYQSPRLPLQWLDIDLASGDVRIVQETRIRGFDPEAYSVQRMFAMAEDGEGVPITLLSRRDAPRDGSMPCLLYGYGAYGVSSDPEFSIPAIALVDRGWTYAIAHVRGGSEKGRQWFLDGRRFKKRNSFTDFVACASHLVDQKIANRDAIVAYGISAGGLLVGGAMNESPHLWAGVIAKVPFVDMLNTMSDGDHPLVPLFRPDWGDPLADPEAYDYMASISPYENVQAKDYPSLLCTAGLKDDRVGYWEAAKFVAEVRHRSTGTAPAVLLLDTDSGHQASGGRGAEFDEMALFWSFAEMAVANRL